MLDKVKLIKIKNKIIDFSILGDLLGYQDYVDTLSKTGLIKYLHTILLNDYNIDCRCFSTVDKLKKNTFDRIKLLTCYSQEQLEIENILENNNLKQIGKNLIIKSGTNSGMHIAKLEISDINPSNSYYTSQFIYNFTGERDIYSKFELYSITYSYTGTYSNGNWIKKDLKMNIIDNIVTKYNNGIILETTTYSIPILYIDKYNLVINYAISI